MKTTKEIISNYDLNSTENFNVNLFDKWIHKIPKGWYGFDLNNVPSVWEKIIDDFLEELNKECPDFEINQIKLKFFQLRFYVNLNTKDQEKIKFINKEINELEKNLYSKDLIY